MIEDERQYQITKAWVRRFSEALERFVTAWRNDGYVHSALLRAEEEGLRSQLADLQAQVDDYEKRCDAPFASRERWEQTGW